MAKKETLYEKTDKKLRKWAGTVGAIVALLGAISGVCIWVSNQFQDAVSAQIADFRSEVESSDKSQTQAITRLELMNLIQNDPTNVAGIEKMARYYFNDLDGDQYMTQKFSDWCKQYGGDPSIAIGGK